VPDLWICPASEAKSKSISENIYFSLNKKIGRSKPDYDVLFRKSCSVSEETERERETSIV
jgi:hypothetical protein